MSVFHRVDSLDQLPAAVFLPRMVRLPLYDGAVRFAIAADAPALERAAPREQAPTPAAGEAVQAPTPHTHEQLAALNQTREYGPLGLSQQVGIFEIG